MHALRNIDSRIARQLDNPVFEAVSQCAKNLETEAYVVGGFVRDLLLGRPCKDIDVVCLGKGLEMARETANMLGVKRVTQFKNFGTAHFVFKGFDVEFVGARKESYRLDSRKPIVEEGSLDDDQKRRDFTINALALSLNQADFGRLVDPFSGINDLENKLLRTPLEPGITFSDDPLRMMRCVRFACQLGFRIEEKAFAALRENAHRLSIVSMERIMDEFNKILLAPKPSLGLRLLFQTGLLREFFPELIALRGVEEKSGIRHKDNFYHTLEVVDNVAAVSDDLWLRWGALLHDIAKPETKRFVPEIGWTFHGHEERGARQVPQLFKRFKLPLDAKMKFVQKLVQLHLRPIALTKEEISDSAIRRLLMDAGDDLEALMILCKADITSKNDEKVARYLRNYDRLQEKLIEVEQQDKLRNWQPPISGETIMQTFGIRPGREVGLIKNAIREAILEGDIHNNFEEAYRLMLAQGTAMGLKPVDDAPNAQSPTGAE